MSKLRFHVCFASGEDPEYPASELNTHSPHTRGWQSPQFADAPQELGLELTTPACLTQVQILSHQSKIATRIELFIGEGDSYEEAHFQRLGYLSLNSNERSRFQARELKSVYIDGPGRFLRLLVHKCYINELNLFNQVGIIAINLLGDPLPPADTGVGAVAAASAKASASRLPPAVPERAISGRHPLPLSTFASSGGGVGNSSSLGASDLPGGLPGARRRRSEMDDLSFDMNFDPETAKRIRDIAAAKERAVAGEDYDTAKRLKQAEVALKGLGTRLSQLEISKRDAVDEEDYDRAKELKGEIEALRGQIEAQVAAGEFQLQGLLRAGPSSNGASIDPRRQPHRGYAFGAGEESGGGGSVGGGRDGRSLTPHDEVPVGTKQADGGIGNMSGTGAGPGGEYGGYGSDAGGTITPPGDWGNGGGLGSGNSALDSPSPPGVGGGGVAGRQPLASQRPSPARGGDDEASLGSARPPGGSGGSGRPAGGGEVFPAGQHPLEGVPGLEELPDPEPLSARVDLSEVQGLNALLGDYVARSLYSKAWALREAATLKVRHRLPELVKEPGLELALPVLAQILRLGAEDKIAQVFLTAMALLHEVLEAAAAERAVRHNVLVTQLEPVVATLLLKLGDGQARVRDGAMDGLLAIARCRAAGAAFVSHMATKPLPRKQATAWRPLQARLQLLTALVRDFGAGGVGGGPGGNRESSGGSSGGGGPSADSVMGFAKSCDAFAHSNAQVRDAARELAVAVYKYVGDDVERHLGSLRPKQLEEYRQAFQEAGGPAGSGLTGGGGGRRKSAESTGGAAAAVGGGGGGDDRAKRRGPAATPAAAAAGGGGPTTAREADGGPRTARGRGGTGAGGGGSGAGGGGGGAGGYSKARAAASPSPSPTRPPVEGRGAGGGGINLNNGGGGRAPASMVRDDEDEYSDGGGEAAGGEEREDMGDRDDGYIANHTCQFCGDYDERYDDDELDLHYWRDCPMLVPCPECHVVVEVVVLQAHLLEECKGRENYRVCSVSGMAVRRDGMAAWQASRACRRPGRLGPSARCPLCFRDVAAAADEESWRDHLIGVCPKNERGMR